jgi:WD40 repeat protein
MPDGRTLISAGSDGVCARLDLATGREVRVTTPSGKAGAAHPIRRRERWLYSAGDGARSGRWKDGWNGHWAVNTKATSSPRAVATVGCWPLWRPDTAALGYGIRTRAVAHWAATRTADNRLAFSPDGSVLARGPPRSSGQGGTWKRTQRGRLDGAAGRTIVTALHFSPDGQTLAVAADGVRLWDVQSARLLSRWQGHRASVLTLSFAPDGGTLLSGGADATALLWTVPSVR